MSRCAHAGCSKPAEEGKDICFRHRIASVGVKWHGGARKGRTSWNVSKKDFMLENFGTTNERELAQRGIVRQDKL